MFQPKKRKYNIFSSDACVKVLISPGLLKVEEVQSRQLEVLSPVALTQLALLTSVLSSLSYLWSPFLDYNHNLCSLLDVVKFLSAAQKTEQEDQRPPVILSHAQIFYTSPRDLSRTAVPKTEISVING